MDEFISAALKKNVELTVINDPGGQHGFDIEDNTDASHCDSADVGIPYGAVK